jgi:pimeloyl-ACP methyl ester carboxylesterase
MADIVMKEGAEPVAWAMMPKLFAQCSSEQCPAIIASVRQMVMTSNPVAIAAAHRGMAVRPDVSDLLPTITLPTLVICGEHDVISPPDEMKSIAEKIPNAQFVQVPRAGHMSPMEQPEIVNAAIRKFLGG